MRGRGVLAGLLLVAGVTAACASPLPSPTASPTVAAGNPGVVLDFAGTAWRVESIGDLAVVAADAPTLVIDAFGRDSADGWSGCDQYAVQLRLTDGRAAVGEFTLNPQGCSDPSAELEQAFVGTLASVATYRLDGDVLALDGPNGGIRLRRDVPPPGDPLRAILDTLRASEWRVVAGPDLPIPEAISPLRFADTRLFAVGACGFGGRYRLFGDSGIDIAEVGYDAMGCGSAAADATREAVVRLLGTVDSIALVEGVVELRGEPDELRLEAVPSRG